MRGTVAHWPYYMAGMIAVAALAVIFWPHSQATPQEGLASGQGRVGIVVLVDETQLGEASAIGEKLTFRRPGEEVRQDVNDTPPIVLGVMRTGRRGLAYVQGANGPGRLSVGESVGGWTLASVGGNYADFDRASERRRVRLFQQDGARAPASGSATDRTDPSTEP